MKSEDLSEVADPPAAPRAAGWPFLAGGGEMGALMRAHDWSTSPLGDPGGWPQSLRTTVSLMLNSRYPMFIAWGPELAFLYNDGYRPIFGAKHPHTLGLPFAEVWSEIWDDIRPLVDRALAGEATFHENLHLVMERNGFPEDTWYTFSYSPVRDESGDVGGMFCACTETTRIVQAERENRLERERLAQMFEQAPGFMALLEGPEHRFELTNPAYQRLIGGRDVVGKPVAEALPEAAEQGFVDLLDQVYRSGKAFTSVGARFVPRAGPGEPADERYLDFVYQPLTDAEGKVTGIFAEGVDVTERTQIDAKLRESEERFRRIADSAPVPMWVTLLSRKRGFVNRAYVDFLGVSYDEATEFDWRTIIHPDDHDRIVAESVAGEAALAPFHLVARYRRSDGEWRWLHSISQPRFGADGAHAGFIGVAHDITEAKEAEAELRASEERLKLVQAAGKIGSFDYDLQIDDAVCSPEYYAIHGLPEGSPINRESWTRIIHPDDRGDAIEALNRSAAGRHAFRHEYRIVRADTGEVRWLSGRAEVVFDDAGRPWRFVGGVIDITERREAEEAARASEEQLRTITDSLPVLIAFVDTKERYRFANKAYEDWFGRPRDALIGRTIRELVGDEAYANLGPFIARALAGERFGYEAEIPYRDGGVRAVHIDYVPARDDDGEVVGYYALVQDVAERRAAEEALRELNETLESRVVEETAERLRAEETLRQAHKMEAIGQLTGGIAHDFNNLLTIILNSVELLGRPGVSEERRARYIAAIGETAERAARLTAQLLAFARRQPLASEAFDVCERIDSLESMLLTVLGARVDLTIETGQVCCVEADPNQFDTALLNMAVNARDAMPNGGRLTIATAETADGKLVEVRIADTGAGIAPDKVESIFEPFFTTKGVGKGTGLGLSQVYGFARQSGGDIRVESTPGKGSTFILSLPHATHRRLDPLAERPTLPPGPDAIPGKGRILVVEDNRDVGEFGARLLEDLGYEVVRADDAAAALALIDADARGFDLVLTDIVMPGAIDGLALARRLARERPGLPVVLTTGYAHALVDDKAHGFEVLRKPYSIAELSLLLHQAIDAKG